jgi:hypothetical protein
MIAPAGRTGALGALMDEYERALGELAGVLGPLSQYEFDGLRDAATADPDCRSIRSVLGHVVHSGLRYTDRMREAIGMIGVPAAAPPGTPRESIERIALLAETTEATFDGMWGMDPESLDDFRNLEQVFEHAIVHILRHRRQIELWLGTWVPPKVTTFR